MEQRYYYMGHVYIYGLQKETKTRKRKKKERCMNNANFLFSNTWLKGEAQCDTRCLVIGGLETIFSMCWIGVMQCWCCCMPKLFLTFLLSIFYMDWFQIKEGRSIPAHSTVTALLQVNRKMWGGQLGFLCCICTPLPYIWNTDLFVHLAACYHGFSAFFSAHIRTFLKWPEAGQPEIISKDDFYAKFLRDRFRLFENAW